MFKWFRKKPIDLRVWNEDWKIGDMAQCINDNWVGDPGDAPKKGRCYEVKDTTEGLAIGGKAIIYGLKFYEFPGRFWQTTHFRKFNRRLRIIERILNARPGRDVVREPEEIEQ